MSMENSTDNIGNRTRDLPTCRSVPQPTALPRAATNNWNLPKMERNHMTLYINCLFPINSLLLSILLMFVDGWDAWTNMGGCTWAKKMQPGAVRSLQIWQHPLGFCKMSETNMVIKSDRCEGNITKPIHTGGLQSCYWQRARTTNDSLMLGSQCKNAVESSWNVMAHVDARDGEVKLKLANGVGSQYSSHYHETWCVQHYYRWCAHLGCQ